MSDKIIYGVQLHSCGQICYFTPGSWFDLKKGDHVVVLIDRGENLAEIVRILNAQKANPLTQENSAHALAQTSTPEISPAGAPLPRQGETESSDSKPESMQNEPRKNLQPAKNDSINASFQWEVWDGNEQEEGVGDAESGICHDPNSPNIQPIIRPANDADLKKAQANQELCKEAHCFCTKRMRHHKLVMKMVQAEYLLDGSKIIFYFTAPNRIDFRELVKDLVKEFRTRIELRQIGVRHETQMLGATGNCGMVCCCRRYMRRFAPVTIKMAKEQNLFLNPVKISGTCGRLLCCLAFEQEGYEEFHRRCPKIGKKYSTTNGPYKVLRSSIFRNTVSILPEEGEECEVTLEQWQTMEPARQGQTQNQPRKQTAQNPDKRIENSAQQNNAKDNDQRHQRNEQNQPKHHRNPQSERSGSQNKAERLERPDHHRRAQESKPENKKNEHDEGHLNPAIGTDIVPKHTESQVIHSQAQASNSEQVKTILPSPETNKIPAKQAEIKTVGLARFLATTGDDD